MLYFAVVKHIRCNLDPLNISQPLSPLPIFLVRFPQLLFVHLRNAFAHLPLRFFCFNGFQTVFINPLPLLFVHLKLRASIVTAKHTVRAIFTRRSNHPLHRPSSHRSWGSRGARHSYSHHSHIYNYGRCGNGGTVLENHQ